MSAIFIVLSVHCLLFLRFVFCQTDLKVPFCFCVGIARGCNFINRYLPSDGSKNKENVALGKKALSSSTYRQDDPRYGVFRDRQGCLAVNGNRDTNYFSFIDNSAKANCIHTYEFDNSPKWTLNLGRNYTITDIVVYLRKASERRFMDVSITVDNQLCYTNTRPDIPTVFSLQCLKPVTGQIIIVSKPRTLIINENQGQEFSINMCEFEVWVCQPGFYGSECNMTCDNCKGGCDNYYGTCLTAECSDGFYGEKCDLQCGKCSKGEACDVRGKCKSGCQPGWHGDECKHVDLICPDGFYNFDCTLKCGRCLDIICDYDNGNCPSGCEAQWIGIKCNIQNISESPVTNDNVKGTVGSMIGIIIAAAVLVVVAAVILAERKTQQEHYERKRKLDLVVGAQNLPGIEATPATIQMDVLKSEQVTGTRDGERPGGKKIEGKGHKTGEIGGEWSEREGDEESVIERSMESRDGGEFGDEDLSAVSVAEYDH